MVGSFTKADKLQTEAADHNGAVGSRFGKKKCPVDSNGLYLRDSAIRRIGVLCISSSPLVSSS